MKHIHSKKAGEQYVLSAERERQHFIYFLIIALVFVYPIIHANFYFADDLTRSIHGYSGWEKLGRPFSAIVQMLLTASNPFYLAGLASTPHHLVDTAPLSQIGAAITLAATAYLYNQYGKRIHGMDLFFVAVLLMLNPFFLYNLSYRFGALGMMLSILCAVKALTLFSSSPKHHLYTVAWLVASLSLYQSGANIFIALTGIELILLSKQGKISLIYKAIMHRGLQYLAALIIYSLTISQLFVSSDNESRGEIIPIGAGFFGQLHSNILDFYGYWISFFSPGPLFYLSIFALFAFGAYTLKLINGAHSRLSIFCFITAWVCYLISLPGAQLILDPPSAGYRTMPAFYMFTLIFISASIARGTRFSYFWLIPVGVSISLSYQYGVAARDQREHDANIASMIHYDLLKEELDLQPIYVTGSMPIAPRNKVIHETNPFIAHMTTPLNRWALESYLQGLGLSSVAFHWDEEYLLAKESIRKVVCDSSTRNVTENSIYSIKSDNHVSVLLLKPNHTMHCNIPSH